MTRGRSRACAGGQVGVGAGAHTCVQLRSCAAAAFLQISYISNTRPRCAGLGATTAPAPTLSTHASQPAPAACHHTHSRHRPPCSHLPPSKPPLPCCLPAPPTPCRRGAGSHALAAPGVTGGAGRRAGAGQPGAAPAGHQAVLGPPGPRHSAGPCVGWVRGWSVGAGVGVGDLDPSRWSRQPSRWNRRVWASGDAQPAASPTCTACMYCLYRLQSPTTSCWTSSASPLSWSQTGGAGPSSRPASSWLPPRLAAAAAAAAAATAAAARGAASSW